jgi:hypothetical protein
LPATVELGFAKFLPLGPQPSLRLALELDGIEVFPGRTQLRTPADLCGRGRGDGLSKSGYESVNRKIKVEVFPEERLTGTDHFPVFTLFRCGLEQRRVEPKRQMDFAAIFEKNDQPIIGEAEAGGAVGRGFAFASAHANSEQSLLGIPSTAIVGLRYRRPRSHHHQHIVAN